ncbi:flotillin-like FloA family protein [Gaoshiqia sp. Z1-71]|uniref:flotillin-like FloA family protein n=1 Tax=Gaoshiqia hydrogeniformans TaxID=3290090 RepID=UPI003BF80960
MESYLSNIFLLAGIVVVLLIILYYIPFGLWFTATLSGVRISIMEIILMRFRKTPPALIIQALIMSHKGGVPVNRDQLEAHYLAGGNVNKLVYGLVVAKKAGLKISFEKAAAADLQGVDLFESVKAEVAKRAQQEPLFE